MAVIKLEAQKFWARFSSKLTAFSHSYLPTLVKPDFKLFRIIHGSRLLCSFRLKI